MNYLFESLAQLFGRAPSKPGRDDLIPEVQVIYAEKRKHKLTKEELREMEAAHERKPRSAQVAQPPLGNADCRQPAVRGLLLFRRAAGRRRADRITCGRFPYGRSQLGAAGHAGLQACRTEPVDRHRHGVPAVDSAGRSDLLFLGLSLPPGRRVHGKAASETGREEADQIAHLSSRRAHRLLR